MTTIAYRDGIMAADTLVTSGYRRTGHVVKIVKTPEGWLVGSCGNLGGRVAVANWITGGAKFNEPVKFPDSADVAALIVDPNGKVYHVDDEGSFLIEVQAPFHAIGSGCEYAMTAMLFGASALKSIATAIQFDLGSGGNVNFIKLTGGEDLTLPKEIYNLVNPG